MTTIRRHDEKGRSTGRLKPDRLSKIEGQFIAHRIEMRASPAWRSLSHEARLVLDRLELEHASHAGRENGNLPCTYQDFVEAGCRRSSISDALREVVALGFVEVTAKGRAGNAEFRSPSRYRLTYIQGNLPFTDEWKRFPDCNSAAQAAAEARVQRAKRLSRDRATSPEKTEVQAHG